MPHFHKSRKLRRFLRGPLQYARALRDAKRAVRNQKKWADPFYLGALCVGGEVVEVV